MLEAIKVPKNKDLTYWNVPVPRPLNRALEEAIRKGTHVSKADFIRDAVRRLLREIGYLTPKNGEKEGEKIEHK